MFQCACLLNFSPNIILSQCCESECFSALDGCSALLSLLCPPPPQPLKLSVCGNDCAIWRVEKRALGLDTAKAKDGGKGSWKWEEEKDKTMWRGWDDSAMKAKVNTEVRD